MIDNSAQPWRLIAGWQNRSRLTPPTQVSVKRGLTVHHHQTDGVLSRKESKVKIAELLQALEDARAGLEAALAGLDETQLLAADTHGT